MAQPLFDLSKPHLTDLPATCPVVPGATVSKALLNMPEGKVIVFSMDAGQEISDHRAPFAATVQVLDGRLLFGIAGEEHTMGPHAWLSMPPDAPHRLKAIEPTRFVLTLFKAPARSS